jgi:hypothetical protein
MTPEIETSDCSALQSLVRGTVHLPGGEGYDGARQVWNGMIDRRPVAVVCAAGVADVMATVRFASAGCRLRSGAAGTTWREPRWAMAAL